MQVENLVVQRGKGSSPRSLSREGTELGFQYFFSGTITGCTDLEVKERGDIFWHEIEVR